MIGDDTFYWENPQNGIKRSFSMDRVLDYSIKSGSEAKSFDELSEDEIDRAVLAITEES